MHDAKAQMSSAFVEICRVLKPGGTYIMMSYNEPDYYLPKLQGCAALWSVRTDEIAKDYEPHVAGRKTDVHGLRSRTAPDVHHIYVCTKLGVPLLPP